ncbi:hypothetical protein ZHAS_00014038 [Anopheles sinensis]|uniref:Uncharacterized protein n=1 Tax=Anopheles sinensis TaxID=74873 RepID=A0A084W772_ANOSI|nr:hypothetical protein ZHAS_00014038 [Anopheles sinensis]
MSHFELEVIGFSLSPRGQTVYRMLAWRTQTVNEDEECHRATAANPFPHHPSSASPPSNDREAQRQQQCGHEEEAECVPASYRIVLPSSMRPPAAWYASTAPLVESHTTPRRVHRQASAAAKATTST